MNWLLVNGIWHRIRGFTDRRIVCACGQTFDATITYMFRNDPPVSEQCFTCRSNG